MKKMNIIVFLLIISVLGVMNVFQSKDVMVSENENRNIEKPELTLDALIDGDYFRAVDSYFSDTFIMRDKFIGVSAKLDILKGVKLEDDVEIIMTSAINVSNRIAEKPTSETDINQSGYDDNQILDDDLTQANESIATTSFGQILIVGSQAMEVHTLNEDASNGYSEAINDIADKVDARVFSLLVPTLIEFTEKEKYKDLSYSQMESIKSINENFINKVDPIDVYTELESHKNEYIFMGTDHHWTGLGAYRAYEAFCDQTGIESIPLESFERVDFEGYLGSLYRVSQSEKLVGSPDTIYAYLPVVDTEYQIYRGSDWVSGKVIDLSFFNQENPESAYGVYLQGDSALSIITSDIDNDRSILIIKDSYANAVIPFLTSHYKSIHIIDPRMYTGNIVDYINEEQVDEVLFLNYVLVNRFTGYIDLLNTLSDRF